MWFWLSIIAMLCWSGSDIFSKIGSKQNDKYSHWKMVMAVGLVMGLHAAYEIFVNKVPISFGDILTYMPASALYILSMIFGYVSLRYIELSISSPICNSSGALAAILCLIFLKQDVGALGMVAIGVVAAGVLLLGIVNANEDEELRVERQKNANRKYARSFLALLLPLLYCLIDAAGTFVDTLILREEDTGTILDSVFATTLPEDTANVAYELTFLFMGIVAAIYVLVIRRDRLIPKDEGTKLLGGVCETAGQFAYIFALGDTAHAAPAAAIISAYCVMSLVWSHIFLKEKLSWKHYVAIAITAIGIITLGVLDI
ncbi:MAG: EamA family transporter [Oscillospiraceae bacterium]|nr:EamA family transporter [Oscillospiraceae bacterium]